MNYEQIIRKIVKSYYKPKQNSYPGGYDEYWESWYSNPKGEKIPLDAIMSVEEQVAEEILKKIKSDYVIENPDKIKRKPYKRDNTQKYKTVDEPLNNKMYWGKDNTWK